MAHSRISRTVEPGRTYDIDFINWDQEVSGEAQFIFGEVSKKTTGIIKSVNKFLKILLTYRGSDPFNRARGTYFDDLYYMGGADDTEIGTFATEQINSALSQVQEIQAQHSFPDDENLTTAILTSLSKPGRDKVIFNIQIRSESGAGVAVKVPIIGGV